MGRKYIRRGYRPAARRLKASVEFASKQSDSKKTKRNKNGTDEDQREKTIVKRPADDEFYKGKGSSI